jgi:hypothetical protein
MCDLAGANPYRAARDRVGINDRTSTTNTLAPPDASLQDLRPDTFQSLLEPDSERSSVQDPQSPSPQALCD